MKKTRTAPKITALALSAVMLASCGAQDETEKTPGTAAPLSNPVAVDEYGDVDMEIALAYETDFDALLKSLDEKTVAEGDTVSDNTNEKTKRVYDWLRENYGNKIISGQQVGNSAQKEDICYYLAAQDLPAIKGFDFIFTTTDMPDPSEWTKMAIDWHTKSNGLVAFCWHWNVPTDIDKYPGSTDKAFYTPQTGNKPSTTFSLKNAVTPGTKEYELVVHDIDLIAIELQKLEAAGVPVLWRPLHEASGGWFWWGAADKETKDGQYYQKLWYMIFDRLENYHKLTNLIWVWNGQSKANQVHPNTYDISGTDVYPSSEDHSEQKSAYKSLEKITETGKMLTLSEVGYIPDPDKVFDSDTVKWLYFMPWNGEFIYSGSDPTGMPKLNTEKMSMEFLSGVMKSDKVITWSKLPDWGGTERNLSDAVEKNLLLINSYIEKEERKN